LYAIHKGWPQGKIVLNDLWLDTTSKIEMLGVEAPLEWRNIPEGSYGRGGKVEVDVPDHIRETFDSDHAVTLRVQLSS
ncbi:MAG TPA: hypothetical protein VFE25_12945, partial [Opitutaceae bacterium]|nr:hypothetical protein [Opitutaceae bacterium]